jgi:hypothetical protein
MQGAKSAMQVSVKDTNTPGGVNAKQVMVARQQGVNNKIHSWQMNKFPDKGFREGEEYIYHVWMLIPKALAHWSKHVKMRRIIFIQASDGHTLSRQLLGKKFGHGGFSCSGA